VTGWGASSTSILTGDLSNAGLAATRYYTGSNPSSTTIQRVVAAAGANDVTVVTTDNAWGDTGQQRLVQALVDAGRPVVAVSLGGPFDIAYFPDVPAYLAAYDYQPVSLHAIVRTLVGASPTGHLPVTISTPDGSNVLYPYGSGLSYPDA
jgi:beta-N-acetylhexosaminidase